MIISQRTELKLEAARVEGVTLVGVMHSEYRWRKTRKQFLLVESCCQACRVIKELEVHHIKPWHLFPELRYDFENLTTLCRSCHYRFGHWLNWKWYNPDIRELCASIGEFRKVYLAGESNEEDMVLYDMAGDVTLPGRIRSIRCSSTD